MSADAEIVWGCLCPAKAVAQHSAKIPHFCEMRDTQPGVLYLKELSPEFQALFRSEELPHSSQKRVMVLNKKRA
jgi:hypothetical protein